MDSKKTTKYDKHKIAVGKYNSVWIDEEDDDKEFVQKMEVSFE